MHAHEIDTPSEAELERVRKLLSRVGGTHVGWGAQSVLDVLLLEQRMASDRAASERLNRATWSLAVATVVLALSTIALVVATIAR